MLDEKKVEKILEGGKVDIHDLDRDADLMWAVADLWCAEKHLNVILNNLAMKLKKKEDEKTVILYDFASYLLNEIRKYRAKHLRNLEKLREYGFWCLYKHLLGAMMQFGEVGAKEISMGNIKRSEECFETSEFCYETIITLNKIPEKINTIEKVKDGDGEEKNICPELQERRN